jgi:PADRE domain
MGCILPRAKPKKFDCVRVVHMNGFVEDYEGPVTAGRVIGKSDRYMLCSSSNILYSGKHAFKPGDPLEPGRIYFLLPITILQSEASPVDFACLLNRLTSLAKKGGTCVKGPSLIDSMLDQAGYDRSPTRACAEDVSGNCQAEKSPDQEFVTGPGKWGSRSAWKPCLDRIDESFRHNSMRTDSIRSNGIAEGGIDNHNEVRNNSGKTNGVVS